jgi:predicted acetyltransferase
MNKHNNKTYSDSLETRKLKGNTSGQISFLFQTERKKHLFESEIEKFNVNRAQEIKTELVMVKVSADNTPCNRCSGYNGATCHKNFAYISCYHVIIDFSFSSNQLGSII